MWWCSRCCMGSLVVLVRLFILFPPISSFFSSGRAYDVLMVECGIDVTLLGPMFSGLSEDESEIG